MEIRRWNLSYNWCQFSTLWYKIAGFINAEHASTTLHFALVSDYLSKYRKEGERIFCATDQKISEFFHAFVCYKKDTTTIYGKSWSYKYYAIAK